MPLDSNTRSFIAQLGTLGDTLETPARDLSRYLERNLRNDLGPLMDANGRILRADILGDEAALDAEATRVRDLIDQMQPRLDNITALVAPLADVPAGMATLRAWAVARVGERVQE